MPPHDASRRHILFVDDEPLILDGLQRMLRPLRKQWDMAFTDCGEEALVALAAHPFDVIVTDMRMPGMDGARLLELVKERFPNVVRIVLSGYFEKETALRAVPVAHQFLAKPCDPQCLREAIDRCCSFGRYVQNDATRRVVGAIGDLPSPHRDCASLLKALDDPDAGVHEIGKIVEHNVAIAAKVLQLVNSAFFGPSQEVTSVTDAVTYLGLDVLRTLVLSAEIFGMFRPAAAPSEFSFDNFQEHSRLSARIAARLPLPKEPSGTAAAAALLHDVGMLVLAARTPLEFEAALSKALMQKRPLHEIELELSGTSHAEVGAYLLGLWGLPECIVDPVGCHHRLPHPAESGAGLNVLAAVHIANVLAIECQAAMGHQDVVPDGGFDFEYLASLGVQDQIPTWRSMAKEIANASLQA